MPPSITIEEGSRDLSATTKNRAEGKGYSQTIRALGRYIYCAVFKMPSQERPYWIDPQPKPETFFKFPLPNSIEMLKGEGQL